VFAKWLRVWELELSKAPWVYPAWIRPWRAVGEENVVIHTHGEHSMLNPAPKQSADTRERRAPLTAVPRCHKRCWLGTWSLCRRVPGAAAVPNYVSASRPPGLTDGDPWNAGNWASSAGLSRPPPAWRRVTPTPRHDSNLSQSLCRRSDEWRRGGWGVMICSKC
jgi:hypothetical protein